eukprot:NODE_26709_length_541_cov_2.214976.p1 GENE.NODE_26709_length_541_cov_2.214976~~NODE_26709_length_541_cov_2.214976.p1  ORF type:complete len:77 (+),score=43.04 NODE_26709_length_541_cov_2.214976:232-462(+)
MRRAHSAGECAWRNGRSDPHRNHDDRIGPARNQVARTKKKKKKKKKSTCLLKKKKKTQKKKDKKNKKKTKKKKTKH